MIIGIGTDICEVQRLQESLNRHLVLEKCFTEQEIKYARSKHNPYVHYAGMWAAKEAYSKAYDSAEIPFLDIEVQRTENGKPFIVNIKSVHHPYERAHVSISHTQEIATATVLLESIV